MNRVWTRLPGRLNKWLKPVPHGIVAVIYFDILSYLHISVCPSLHLEVTINIFFQQDWEQQNYGKSRSAFMNAFIQIQFFSHQISESKQFVYTPSYLPLIFKISFSFCLSHLKISALKKKTTWERIYFVSLQKNLLIIWIFSLSPLQLRPEWWRWWGV